MSTISATPSDTSRIALVTGGSRGFGRALASALAQAGWRVVIDGRDAGRLNAARDAIPNRNGVVAVPGDITDPEHRRRLAAAVDAAGGLDLLVNNASVLGPSPQPPLAGYAVAELGRVYEVNVMAPLALFQLVCAELERRAGCLVNVSSDAAVAAYAGWGGYGSSKAALDQLTAVLSVEHPGLRVYAFDPGDMNTAMHQEAFPDEDISDRPSPGSVVPALLRLVGDALPSGRYRLSDIPAAVAR